MVGSDWPGAKKWKLFDMDRIRQQYAQFAKDEEEKLLIVRYSELGEWIAAMRTLCSRSAKPLQQALQEALGDNRTLTNTPQRFKPQDGESYIRSTTSRERVREPDYGTLLQRVRTGPDRLRFFIMLCPHARDAFLKGELPPYPWRVPAVVAAGATPETEVKRNGHGQSSAPPAGAGKDSQRKLQAKKSNGVREKPRGRPRKYSDVKCKKALKQFGDLYAKNNDAFAAWHTVADNLDFPSGEAARKACERYRQSQLSGQNGHK